MIGSPICLVFPNNFQRIWLVLLLAFLARGISVGDVLLNELVGYPLGDVDEFKRLHGLLYGQEHIASESIDCHHVVQVALCGFIELRDYRLGCINGLEAGLVFLLFGVEQCEQLELKYLFFPVEIERVVRMDPHEPVPCA